MNRLHCSWTWCWPSQELASIFTTSRRAPLPATVRCQCRARNSWEMKANGQIRRQSS